MCVRILSSSNSIGMSLAHWNADRGVLSKYLIIRFLDEIGGRLPKFTPQKISVQPYRGTSRLPTNTASLALF